MKSIDFWEKKCSQAGFKPTDLLNASQLLYPLSYMAEVLMECCSSVFHFIAFNPPQNASWLLHQLAMANLKEEDDGFIVLSS